MRNSIFRVVVRLSIIEMWYAIFFNSSGPVVQVPCPSGHKVTGRFYKNSVLKKVRVLPTVLRRWSRC